MKLVWGISTALLITGGATLLPMSTPSVDVNFDYYSATNAQKIEWLGTYGRTVEEVILKHATDDKQWLFKMHSVDPKRRTVIFDMIFQGQQQKNLTKADMALFKQNRPTLKCKLRELVCPKGKYDALYPNDTKIMQRMIFGINAIVHATGSRQICEEFHKTT